MNRLWVVLLISIYFFVGCENFAPKDRQTLEKKNGNNNVSSQQQKSLEQQQSRGPLGLTQFTPQDFSAAADLQKQNSSLNSFQPFYIFSDKGSRENHYVPSGFMPNGKCILFNDAWTENCYSGKTCIKVTYDVQCSKEDQRWAGIYWLNPANNWGNRKGGFSLTGAQKLTFWAKGDVGGEQIQEFTLGGITGDFPDTDIAVIGPVILKPEWRQYIIDLRGKDLSYISGGFAWTATTTDHINPESCVFYLDEIKFE